LGSIDLGDLESSTTHKNDQDLATDHDAVDTNEEIITMDTFEDVEFVIQTTVVELVEYLHPNEGIEDHGRPEVWGWREYRTRGCLYQRNRAPLLRRVGR